MMGTEGEEGWGIWGYIGGLLLPKKQNRKKEEKIDCKHGMTYFSSILHSLPPPFTKTTAPLTTKTTTMKSPLLRRVHAWKIDTLFNAKEEEISAAIHAAYAPLSTRKKHNGQKMFINN